MNPTKKKSCSKTQLFFCFESICVEEVSYKETETTKSIGRHIPISASISSNLVQEPTFLRNTNSYHLVSTFIIALEGLATQRKASMKSKYNEIETAINIKLCKRLEHLNQRHNRAETVMDFVENCIVASEEQDLFTKLLQMQKNQIIDIQ